MDFAIPAQPEDLLDEDKAPGLRVLAATNLAELSKEDVNEFAERERTTVLGSTLVPCHHLA